jgi:hypothetical protein
MGMAPRVGRNLAPIVGMGRTQKQVLRCGAGTLRQYRRDVIEAGRKSRSGARPIPVISLPLPASRESAYSSPSYLRGIEPQRLKGWAEAEKPILENGNRGRCERRWISVGHHLLQFRNNRCLRLYQVRIRSMYSRRVCNCRS